MNEDEKPVAASEAVSPQVLADAAALDRKKAATFEAIAVPATEFLSAPPPRRRILLATAEPRRGLGGELDPHPADAWLPDGKLGLLCSPGGKGKTSVLLSLAVHVAAGANWYGLHVARRGRVLVLLGEEDRGEAHRRVAAVLAQLGESDRLAAARRLTLLPLAGHGSARLVEEDPKTRVAKASERGAELAEFIRRDCEANGDLALIIFDPFARFAGLNAETDNASATETMVAFEAFTKVPGCPTVLVAVHARKGGASDDPADKVRGSSAIRDAARWLGEVRPVDMAPDWVSVVITKSNYTGQNHALRLRTEHGVVVDGRVVDLRREAQTLAGTEPSKAKSGTRLGRGMRPETPRDEGE